MGPCDFKMLSLNVRGLSNFKKQRSIFAWCRKPNANIIFLQETHSTHEKEKQWKSEWGAPLELAHGSSNARGVAILLQNGFDCKIKQKFVHPSGRYIGKLMMKTIIYSMFTVLAMIIINVKKILAVITATYAVAKRKPEKTGLPGFEP